MKSPSSGDATEQFETRSLTMAAYLSLEGFDPTVHKVSEAVAGSVKPYGVWRFPDEPDLQKKVQLFQAKEASVEPEAFHNKMAEFRREVMAIVG